jgi:nucleotide-binding universal stress UspA family protein
MKFLLPVDFSIQTEHALVITQNLAKRLENVELNLLHVSEISSEIVLDENGELPDTCESDISSIKSSVEIAKEKLKLIENNTLYLVKKHLLIGALSESVNKIVDKEKIDLVVMGTSGTSGIKGFVAGSNAQNVIRKSNVPVLTVMCNREDLVVNSVLWYFDKNSLGLTHSVDFINKLEFQDLNFHILTNASEHDYKKIEELLLSLGIKNYTLIFSKENPETALIHQLQQKDADVIFMGRKPTATLSTIFGKSESVEKIVSHFFKPIISYPIR